ncbi:EAL domain-containing protein [Dongia soli]|uniref:EAL domain-containing protein n=1 Tax=Dongia soli TaxID=600628 RepID=A0ABU5E9A1_9PROT|nr:EAL domain-containing protein [Dongia soli]MDY0882426.1 EAL domain-containing protein [Dongia soli]
MRRGSHVLIFCLYALAAAVLAYGLPRHLPMIKLEIAIIAGGFILLFAALLHVLLALAAHNKALRREMAEVEQAMNRLYGDQQRLTVTVERIDESLTALENQAAPDVGNVVAEVKVLQSLVERLYSARANDTVSQQAEKAAAAPVAAAAAAGAPMALGQAAAVQSEKKPNPARRQVQKPAPAAAAEAGKAVSPTEANGASLPMPPIAEGLDESTILDLVRDGLRENGVELAVQPIVSLPQRKRRYFECSSPIRVGQDRVLVPEQYIDIAERHGLITAIDNLMLFRCIQMLRRLRRSNATTGFFLNISHYTLADRDFFRQFINLMSQHVELAPNLIFEFSQRAIENADPALWGDLGRLAQMGFRFAIDQIYSLDIDVADLSSRHFRFLKLDATNLLEAVSAGQIGDDPSALKRILDSYAIDLIVEGIENENMLRELLDLHIDFGQGYLFGEPRLVRSEMASPLT